MKCRPSFGILAFTTWLSVTLSFSAATIAQSIRSTNLSATRQNSFSANTSLSAEERPTEKHDSYSATPIRPGTPNLFEQAIAGATKIEGMIPLYRKGDRLLAAFGDADFDHDLILLISIARGVGVKPLVGGHSWDFGNDWVCQFRRVGDHVHFVRRNIRHRADSGSPEAEAVELAYADSVLCRVPIMAHGADDKVLVDLSPIFVSDLPGIARKVEGLEFVQATSSWAQIRGYAKNVELQVAATYQSDGSVNFDSIPDARSITVTVHYSLSRLPQSDYRPRIADDRVGYFLTAFKDYSQSITDDRFVRYINRWHLKKSDPTRELSPPVEPIVFWLGKTIPQPYREPIREGILEWNKAFERIGFQNAIEVKQQPEEARWSPGDVRFNTFCWVTSGTSVAAGPSRANPLTGEILDADITFDADFLQVWKRKYESFTPKEVARLTGGPLDLETYRQQQETRRRLGHEHQCACGLLHGISHEMALSAAVLARRRLSAEEMETLTLQALKKVAMHEVGHTLGLRHNFVASTLYSLEEIQRRSLAEGDVVLSASVMDYIPAHLAAEGQPQGRYYPSTIGPYDHWAIEYGYRSFDHCTPDEEQTRLLKIASRSAERELAYGTDEDARGIDPDPHVGRFDYGSDVLAFAEQQSQIVEQCWRDLAERPVREGASYSRARREFGVLMLTYGRAMFAVARHIGGVHCDRSHYASESEETPYEVVDAQRQRQAMAILSQRMFHDGAFQFPPELYRRLAATHWKHWGSQADERRDFPVHESILLWQKRILEKLTSSLTLARLLDSEALIASDKDAFTVAELLELLTADIFAELSSLDLSARYSNRQPAVSSLRRRLQHALVERLSELALGQPEAPSDCQALACWELTRLDRQIEQVLRSEVSLDRYSQAHFLQIAMHIGKVLDAGYTSGR